VFYADVRRGLNYCKEKLTTKVLAVKVGLGVCCW
jgi:hypothetical protein